MEPAKRLLRDRGYTVAGIARARGLDPEHLRNCLDGRTKPSHEVRVALTAALDTPVTELFTEATLTRVFPDIKRASTGGDGS